MTFQPRKCCIQRADSTPGRVPLKQWWKLTFLFLSSNNMAFKVLLTPHNSLMVPFTEVSWAVHPNSELSDSHGSRHTGLWSGQAWWKCQHRANCDKPATFVIACCLAKPHAPTFPYSSSLPLADSWIHTDTKHWMWFGLVCEYFLGNGIYLQCYKQTYIWISMKNSCNEFYMA